MRFYDVLHGQFNLGIANNSQLVQDLLDCPELQRLRHMRQMNFDVPYIQELGTSKRLPHSVGVAYLAEKLSIQHLTSIEDQKALVAAALLHDAAIPPYGHLVEYYLKKVRKDFNHEDILEGLIQGKCNNGNTYYQLLPGRELGVAETLLKHKVDQDKVLELVRPRHRKQSAISADIDLDNIDNVHRMAILMGWDGVKQNTKELLAAIRINKNMCLLFDSTASNQIAKWQDYRQKIYTLIIGNPLCVAHNAFQSKLVRMAIDNKIITPKNWFITEPEFEENVRKTEALKEMGEQLLAGPNYALIDYIWFKSFGDVPISNWSEVEEILRPMLPKLGENYDYFFWVEKKLICREVSYNTIGGNNQKLGSNSVSLFVSKIRTNSNNTGWQPDKGSTRDQWRKSVEQTVFDVVGNWDCTIAYPENYNGNYFDGSQRSRQLELC